MMNTKPSTRDCSFQSTSLGIIGGLGALGGIDVYSKLVKNSLSIPASQHHFEFFIKQHYFDEPLNTGSVQANLISRKFYVFNMIKQFEKQSVNAIMMPCFLSHTFIDELKTETHLPILSMMDSLQAHVAQSFPSIKKIGVLTSDYVQHQCLFEHYFPTHHYSLSYPKPHLQKYLMQAVYGPNGIKHGQPDQNAIDLLLAACLDLIKQGAELILPGFTEIPTLIGLLNQFNVPVVDVNNIYADFALRTHQQTTSQPSFKIGIVGGVGPAATVDFMGKIVRNTPAQRDQDHIQLIVEQNPQIPDRTAHLTSDGADPTLPLYAVCKNLEANHVKLIAIPCNTAHAYVEYIQPHLSIPIVNMLSETIEYIRTQYPSCRTIGLLATNGTVSSRVYHDIVSHTDLTLLTPEPEFQDAVMNAIYGEEGVKAGFTEGTCKQELLRAMQHLAMRGCDALILGCTELPLVFAQNPSFQIAGKAVALLDPTEILALKCINLAKTPAYEAT